MKKMLILIITLLSVNKSCAFEDLVSTPRHYNNSKENISFLDADSSENDRDVTRTVQNVYDEYDQAISDNTNPPKISNTQALLAEVAGALLVKYISLREKARVYFQDIKNVLTQWYHSIIKA